MKVASLRPNRNALNNALQVVFFGEFRSSVPLEPIDKGTQVVLDSAQIPAAAVIQTLSQAQREELQAEMQPPFLASLLKTGSLLAAGEADRAKLGTGAGEWVVTVPGLRSKQASRQPHSWQSFERSSQGGVARPPKGGWV